MIKKGSVGEKIAIGFLFIIAIVGLYAILLNSGLFDAEIFLGGQKKCRIAIKEKLKSPSSAIFTEQTKEKDSIDGGYIYDGYVESQNSFGAMTKTNYKCYIDNETKQATIYLEQ